MDTEEFNMESLDTGSWALITRNSEKLPKTVSAHIAQLYLNKRMSDLHLVFPTGNQSEEIPVHKFVLALRSEKFEKLFLDSPAEITQMVVKNAKVDSFKTILRFIYTDDVTLDERCVVECFHLAKRFRFTDLPDVCLSFFGRILSPNNVSTLMNEASGRNQEQDQDTLTEMCLDFMCVHTQIVFQSDDFLNLNNDCLKLLLACDDLSVDDELDVFNATMRWATHRCRGREKGCSGSELKDILGDCLFMIRFPLISPSDMKNRVRQFGILTKEEYALAEKGLAPNSISQFSLSERKNGLKLVLKNGQKVSTVPADGDCQQMQNIELCDLALNSSTPLKLTVISLKDGMNVIPEQIDVLIPTSEKFEASISDNKVILSNVFVGGEQVTHINIKVAFQETCLAKKPRNIKMTEEIRGTKIEVDGRNTWVQYLRFSRI